MCYSIFHHGDVPLTSRMRDKKFPNNNYTLDRLRFVEKIRTTSSIRCTTRSDRWPRASQALSVFWQKIFYVAASFFLSKYDFANSAYKFYLIMWSKISWRAMYCGYNVIEPFHQGNCTVGLFISISSGKKVQKSTRNIVVIIKKQSDVFLWLTMYCTTELQICWPWLCFLCPGGYNPSLWPRLERCILYNIDEFVTAVRAAMLFTESSRRKCLLASFICCW